MPAKKAKTPVRRSRTTATEPEMSEKIDAIQSDVQDLADAIDEAESVLANIQAEDNTPTRVVKSEVADADRLISGYMAEFEVGVLYEYTHKHKLVGSVDSTVAGKLVAVVVGGDWAPKVAQAIYDAYYVSDDTVDPSTVDVEEEGWSGTLLV